MEPIRTAICSFGLSGRVFHAPFLHLLPGYSLHGVWERSKHQAAQLYPGITSYPTLEALLADEAVELVVVNTPNYTHVEYATNALLAGKHVVIEKPVAVTSGEAQALIDLAAKQNRKLSVYQNRRYDSDFRTVKRIIGENWLGKIVEAEIHFDRYNRNLSPKAHKETPGPGTGVVYDLGSHIIDQALFLFGMPDAVFGDLATQRPTSQIIDYMEILLYYPDLRVRLKSGYVVREAVPGYVIHGEQGSFLKSMTNVQEVALQAGQQPGGNNWGIEPESERGLLHTEKDGKVIRERVPTEQGNYADYYIALQEAIRNNAPVPVSGEDGKRIIQVIEAAYQSSQEKRVIELNKK